MENSKAVIEIRGLSKAFGDREVIQDFDATVDRGEFVTIVGPSGSGKSTLLNIIGLLDKGDSGSVSLFGRPAPRLGSRYARQLLRTKLSYMFQEAMLIEDESVENNLRLAQHYSKVPRESRVTQRIAALAEVGLEGIEKQKVYQLSGGEQQRVALACMRLRPSELILADEPTGSLDAQNRDMVLRHMKRMSAEGKTIVVVTHDPVIAHAATRVLEISRQKHRDANQVVVKLSC